ncbi:hypothetical protein O1D37_003584 [Vibrio cholerae]|nr:hypothetical protein [Vibrio cholerae]
MHYLGKCDVIFKKVLFNWLLPELINHACNSCIPRSGDEGRRINCFVIAVDRNKSPFFVANEYKNKSVKGLRWQDGSYSQENEISLDDFCNEEVRITHYYGLSEITFDSIYDFSWNYISKYVYTKIHLCNYIESKYQSFFNKRKLITKKRMELLRFMMDDQLSREHDSIDLFELMTKLYSIRWVTHPSGDELERKLQLYLDSLVKSGDLTECDNLSYKVNGNALITIERYEEEERRHIEAVKLQKKMVFLTVVLAIIAVVQSGLVKLPVFMDFTVH